MESAIEATSLPSGDWLMHSVTMREDFAPDRRWEGKTVLCFDVKNDGLGSRCLAAASWDSMS